MFLFTMVCSLTIFVIFSVNTMSSEKDSINNINLEASGNENDSDITDSESDTSENETVDPVSYTHLI